MPKKPKNGQKRKDHRGINSIPTLSAHWAVDYAVRRRNTLDVLAGTSVILVLGPYADTVGIVYTQAVFPPDGTTAPSNTYYTDNYLTTMLTPTAVGAAANTFAIRWTSFDVELTCISTLESINQAPVISRWKQGGLPLVNTGTGAGYLDAYNAMLADDTNIERSLASFVHTRRVTTGMRDPEALDFTNVSVGTAVWTNAYGYTAGTTSIGVGTVPFTPIVMWLGNPGTTTLSIRMVVNGNVQVCPPRDHYLSRLAKPLPIRDASVPWWKEQQRLTTQDLVYVNTDIGRNAGPRIGF